MPFASNLRASHKQVERIENAVVESRGSCRRARLGMSSYPLHAATTTGGETVQGFYDALLRTMKNGRTLGKSGRFTQLEPVIRRTLIS